MVRRALAAVAVLALVTVADSGGPADAASSVTSGWWISAPTALALDVGDDDLLVQGDPEGSAPLAYAGVTFVLSLGEVPQRLALDVARESATTPGSTLALCSLGAPAHAAAGEPAEDGPSFDCATTVESEPSNDGGTYEFDVTRFDAAGTLDLAVLPTQPTDRVVLRRPDVSALRSRFEPPDDDGTSGFDFSGGASSGGDSSFGDDGFSTDTGTGEGFGADTPSSAAPPASEPTALREEDGPGAIADEATPPPANQLAAAQQGPSDDDRNPIAPIAFAGLVVAAAVLWTLAGQQSADLSDVPGGQP